jgi:iron(III) transport system permease protein
MRRWRLGAAVVLVIAAGVPLVQPFFDVLAYPESLGTWADTPRLLSLTTNTAWLLGGTLALALPGGLAAAILLFRTDLPLRRGLQFLTVLSLFVPLPLLTSAWQATLGTGGWLSTAVWPDAAGRPWAEGIGPAIWIHALASLPWVILIVGIGLRWIEGEMEEDALLATNPWRVLLRVTLPRSRAAVGAAALWVALQTASEVTVTDMLQVRTFAEEVYTQLGMGGGAALARAVVVAVPGVVLAWLVVIEAVPRLERHLPPLQTLLAPPPLFPLGSTRWPLLAVMLTAVFVLAGIPLSSLVRKAGLQGWPPLWSAGYAWERVATALGLHGPMVMVSLLVAVVAGIVTAAAGLLLAWLGQATPWFAAATLGLLAGIGAMPGPVLGLGFKGAIQDLLDVLGSNPAHPDLLAVLLYYGPSPVPVLVVHVVRFLPFAVALLWPVVRLLPTELRDSARLDGMRPAQEFRSLVWPLARRACLWTGLVVAALSLGEISASKLVETPGSETFAHVVFDRMHYGVTNDVAALCLVLLGAVLLVGGVGGGIVKLRSAANRRPGVSRTVPPFRR